MTRRQLPPIEFDTVDGDRGTSSTPPEVPRGKGWRPSFTGVLVVGLALALAVSGARVWTLTSQRSEAKAEAARADQRAEDARDAGGEASSVPDLLGDLGGVFAIPSSPSLEDGGLAVIITPQGGREFVWLVVDGRGAVPGDFYVVRGGHCENGVAVLDAAGSLADGAANGDGDLRLVANQLGLDVNDPDLWVQVTHKYEILAGVRGPLAHPSAVAPGVDPCDGSDATPSALAPSGVPTVFTKIGWMSIDGTTGVVFPTTKEQCDGVRAADSANAAGPGGQIAALVGVPPPPGATDWSYVC